MTSYCEIIWDSCEGCIARGCNYCPDTGGCSDPLVGTCAASYDRCYFKLSPIQRRATIIASIILTICIGVLVLVACKKRFQKRRRRKVHIPTAAPELPTAPPQQQTYYYYPPPYYGYGHPIYGPHPAGGFTNPATPQPQAASQQQPSTRSESPSVILKEVDPIPAVPTENVVPTITVDQPANIGGNNNEPVTAAGGNNDQLLKASPRFYTVNKDVADQVRAKLNSTQKENERLYQKMKTLEHAVLVNEAVAVAANRKNRPVD